MINLLTDELLKQLKDFDENKITIDYSLLTPDQFKHLIIYNLLINLLNIMVYDIKRDEIIITRKAVNGIEDVLAKELVAHVLREGVKVKKPVE